MSNILGISAYYHDSAAALLQSGEIVAAAQEERFTRKKHDHRFPYNAVDYCLKEAGIEAGDIDHVVFYDKPLLKFDRLLETYLAFAPQGWNSFMRAMPLWLKTKLHLPKEIKQSLGGNLKRRIAFTNHHESHAASAFYPSPFEEAAVMTLDGVGEWDTASIGVGKGHELKLLKTMRFPNSLGLLYSAFTYFTGFRVNSGEYKLMGLAPYGDPRFRDIIFDKLIHMEDDGSFAMDMSYFNYCEGLTMTSRRFDELFEGPPRSPESEISQREMDIAASIQVVTEEIVIRMARHARELTGMKHLCLAGGVALNCVANGKLLREGVFDDLWIAPASGDAGGALGAALFVQHNLLKQPRKVSPTDSMKGTLLGPSFKTDDIESFLKKESIPHHRVDSEPELLSKVAEKLADNSVVGWFQGRMEFGPRALGSRSIIGDARSKDMQSTMNLRIKYRESFRPFAPSVLAEDVETYFATDHESPYMLIVSEVQDSIRSQLSKEDQDAMQSSDLRTRVNVPRSTLPAITHVDMTARVQTVDEQRHGRYWRLIKEFKKQTGCGVVINTSFNVRGEPIVCTPEDAYRCFMATEMDVLVLEDCILFKTEQPASPDSNKEQHLANFSLD